MLTVLAQLNNGYTHFIYCKICVCIDQESDKNIKSDNLFRTLKLKFSTNRK